MKKTSRSILRFVGTLDSTRTTHYAGLQENDERWWIPNDEDGWNEQLILASATSMEKILRGDVLCLPRNQFFDSPGWLNLASYLTQMKLPTFSICLKPGLDPTPENIIFEIANDILRNPKFALSGWPGLSIEERITIANNIENTGKFSKMFDGIVIDSSIKEYFEKQRDALQSVLEYVDPKRLEYTGFHKIRRSTGYKISPWDRLTSDFRSKKFGRALLKKHGESIAREYLEYLGNLVAEMPIRAHASAVQGSRNKLSKVDLSAKVNQWLNQRTNLYREISEYPELIRQLLREHINDTYYDSLTESVTDTGRQLSADNGNKGVPYNTRSNHMDIIKGESSEKFVAIHYNAGIDNNTMAEMVEVLNDDLIQESIANMRYARQNESVSSTELEDVKDRHLEFLTEHISSLIVGQHLQSKVTDFTFNMGGKAIKFIGAATATGIATVLTNFVANPQFDKIFPILFAEEVGRDAAGKIVDKAEIRLRPVKDRLKAWLNHKDSKIIAGRVNEWLKSAWQDNKEN